jgi:hypothetical protein
MRSLVRVAPPPVSRLAWVWRYSRVAWPWVKWLAWGTGQVLLATCLAYLCGIVMLAGWMRGSWRGPE